MINSHISHVYIYGQVPIIYVGISLTDEIPRKDLYKTVWEIKQRRVLDMAADRGAYIDQSQSLRLGGTWRCCFFLDGYDSNIFWI